VDNNGGAGYLFQTHKVLLALAENMDTDPGWSTDFLWTWGIPQGNYGDPTAGYSGDNVYGFNLDGLYPDSMREQHLTTPTLDCSNFPQVFLSFYRWLGVESSRYDTAIVQVSTDNRSWVTIWENDISSLQDDSWIYQEFDLTALAVGQESVQIRWVMGPTDGSISYSGWNIDDVLVYAVMPCTAPLPALTLSGLIVLLMLVSGILYFGGRRIRNCPGRS